nr:MAG TPA: Two component regulator propeller [Caudoviricetes sp.]
MEKSVYVLFRKEDGSIWYAKEGEYYKGVFVEYIYP